MGGLVIGHGSPDPLASRGGSCPSPDLRPVTRTSSTGSRGREVADSYRVGPESYRAIPALRPAWSCRLRQRMASERRAPHSEGAVPPVAGPQESTIRGPQRVLPGTEGRTPQLHSDPPLQPQARYQHEDSTRRALGAGHGPRIPCVWPRPAIDPHANIGARSGTTIRTYTDASWDRNWSRPFEHRTGLAADYLGRRWT